MHDQLACLQAQLLLLAAGDTHPHAGHQSSDLSPSDEGKGRRWAALAGPTWWRERVCARSFFLAQYFCSIDR